MIRALLIAFALLAAGCVPRLQPVLPGAQAPRLTDSAFIAADGKEMAVQRWQPAAGSGPRAIIVAVHGFNDYANAFDSSAAFFAERGILTIAYDQRGFGRDGQAGIWAGAERMAADLQQILALVGRAHPHVPLYVLGQSMGGAVALLALSGGRLGEDAGDATPEDTRPVSPAVDGVILVAPAVWGWSSMNVFYRGALWLGAHATPGWRLTGKSLDVVPSDNIEMLRAQGRDPLVIKKTRVDAIYGLVGMMDDALAAAPGLRVPVLLLYGEKDEIIPAKPMAKLRARLDEGYEYHLYPNGYHMLLRDLQPEQVLGDVVEFIDRRAPPGAPPEVAAVRD